jgi:hypothetical protein
MSKFPLPFLLALLLALFPLGNAQGIVIFNSFNNNEAGATSTIHNASGKAVAFLMPGSLQPAGTTSYTLDSVGLRLSGNSASSAIVLSLYSNDGGNTPNTLITSFTAASAFSLTGTAATYTFTPTTTVNLVAGARYWVTINTTHSSMGGTLAWHTSSPQPASYSTVGVTTGGAVFGSDSNPGGWTTTSPNVNGLIVNATAVPEPSALALVLGVSLLVPRRRRRSG